MDNASFIQGKLIYFRQPDIEADIHNGSWHAWFNDPKVCQYLVHGRFPNSKADQVRFVEQQLEDTSTVLFSIVSHDTHKMVGVISIKDIDTFNRTGEITIVMGNDSYPKGAPLEAMALMTTYGFDKLNLNKIGAGQHVGLWKWVNSLELIGYKLEGYLKGTHIKDRVIADSVRVGITLDAYEQLLATRGYYLPDNLNELVKQRRKENMCDKLKQQIDALYQHSAS